MSEIIESINVNEQKMENLLMMLLFTAVFLLPIWSYVHRGGKQTDY